MFVAVLIRRLKPGKTYADFVDAWYPDKGFGIPVRGPDLGVSIDDDREIAAIAYLDLPTDASVDQVMEQIAAQEAARHDRIQSVIEDTLVRGIYHVRDQFDFSTDASVAASLPTTLPPR